MRIVFVLEHYYPYLGGAEKLFRQLAEQFSTAGHQVSVVTTQYRPELPKREEVAGVDIIRVDCKSRFLFTLLSIPAIWAATSQADVVLTTTYNAALPAWIVTRVRRLKTILVFHERWGKLWFKLPYLSLWGRIAFYGFEWLITRLPFEYYVAVSAATRRSLIAGGIPADRIHHIYNGLMYSHYKDFTWQAEPDAFNLLYFGRLGVSKGLDLLLPAWANFVRKHGTGRLQLVIPTYPKGLYQRIKGDLERLMIPKRHLEIHHELERTELFELVAKANAVVIPSYSEGFCFVAAEAMAIGTPIISSGQGSLAEVVGGRHVRMQELSVSGLEQAIEAAFQGQWIDSPPREFPLEQSIQAYFRLLSRVGE